MITRLFVKNHLSFEEINLEFGDGLNVFTGISGAGKSVLMNAILSIFGFKDAIANLGEADIDYNFNLEEFGISQEEINTFKFLKQKSTRYFINNQAVSKKNLLILAKDHLKYLSTKEITEFENPRLLKIVDKLASNKFKDFAKIKEEFGKNYKDFAKIKKELDEINEKENKIEELKEFAQFEIKKIEEISPKVGEFEELMDIKKLLSKKDRIEESWNEVDIIFSLENKIINILNLSECDSEFFSDAMNELRNIKAKSDFSNFEYDIEEILDRIESLNSLQKRYGSIENALQNLKNRKIELEKYEKIEFEKSELNKEFLKIKKLVFDNAKSISTMRSQSKGEFLEILNKNLKALYLDDCELNLQKCELNSSGQDKIEINLKGTELKKLSTGEINRLRLAFIASEVEILDFGNGVLILDEVDANLSGKEAMSIAKVLKILAKKYQILAISHLPQLSSQANAHYLVEKENGISKVRKLDFDERIKELARMISGDKISKEANEFAKKLLQKDAK